MRSSSEHPYWLFNWLSSNDIHSRSRAAKVLQRSSEVDCLREISLSWSNLTDLAFPGHNLVAGTGLRLDDYITCPSPACRKQQVDVLFRHAWHYFDNILLPDGVGYKLHHEDENGQGWLSEVLDWIEVAVYIKDLGAASLVSYFPVSRLQAIAQAKVTLQENHAWNSAWREVEAICSSPDRFEIRQDNHEFSLRYLDPVLRTSITFPFGSEEVGSSVAADLRSTIAKSITGDHREALERDMACAEVLGGTLGSSLWSHEEVRRKVSESPEIASLLFELDFPSLTNIPLRELIAIRSSEQAAFIALRSALAKAAREAILMSPNTMNLSEQLRLDVIEPQLAKLTLTLRAAERTLQRKTMASLAITGISTLCGFAINPAVGVLAGGVGLASSGINGAYSKYFEEKQTLESSEFFLLWKTLDHAS